MTVINSELYNASKAYISAALRLLKERCGDVSKLPREESEKWNNVQGSFYRQRGSKPDWAACIRMVKDEMHALPEYGGVIEQLNTDSVAARHLDALVGSPSTGSSRPATRSSMPHAPPIPTVGFLLCQNADGSLVVTVRFGSPLDPVPTAPRGDPCAGSRIKVAAGAAGRWWAGGSSPQHGPVRSGCLDTARW